MKKNLGRTTKYGLLALSIVSAMGVSGCGRSKGNVTVSGLPQVETAARAENAATGSLRGTTAESTENAVETEETTEAEMTETYADSSSEAKRHITPTLEEKSNNPYEITLGDVTVDFSKYIDSTDTASFIADLRKLNLGWHPLSSYRISDGPEERDWRLEQADYNDPYGVDYTGTDEDLVGKKVVPWRVLLDDDGHDTVRLRPGFNVVKISLSSWDIKDKDFRLGGWTAEEMEADPEGFVKTVFGTAYPDEELPYETYRVQIQWHNTPNAHAGRSDKPTFTDADKEACANINVMLKAETGEFDGVQWKMQFPHIADDLINGKENVHDTVAGWFAN